MENSSNIVSHSKKKSRSRRRLEAGAKSLIEVNELETNKKKTVNFKSRLRHLKKSNKRKQKNKERVDEFSDFIEVIKKPQTTIVQHPISGNEIKVVAIYKDNEQRKITFELPEKDCTIQDLLDVVINNYIL